MTDLAALVYEHLDKLRPPCDTCGGHPSCWENRTESRDEQGRRIVTYHCPDCDDGRLSWDVFIPRVAALWDVVHVYHDPKSYTHREALSYLRDITRVGRQP